MEKAKIADLHKAPGKHVPEETPHELEGLEAHALIGDRGAKDVVVEGLHAGENPDDLVLSENHRDREELPAPIEHRLEVELDAGVTQSQRRRLPPALVSTVQQVALKLLLFSLLRLFLQVVGQLAYRT